MAPSGTAEIVRLHEQIRRQEVEIAALKRENALLRSGIDKNSEFLDGLAATLSAQLGLPVRITVEGTHAS